MKIWVDADACPKAVKEILFRAAERTKIPVTLVANQYLSVPRSPHIHVIQVADGFDVADEQIVELCVPGDLVVTADIPLASLVIKKGAFALNPRGELYDSGNIGPVLSMRDFMDSMRGGLMEQGTFGPAAFSQNDRQKFAAALDTFITRRPARS